MTTEQYSMGYDAGYQDGWDAAVDSVHPLTNKQAMELALEVLEKIYNTNGYWWQEVDEETVSKMTPTIAALREALAEQQEPYCYVYKENGEDYFAPPNAYVPDNATPLYKSPQPPAPVQEPVAWKHDCAALLTNDVELWIDRCPHCGKPRTSQQPAQRKPLTDEEIVAIGRELGLKCLLGDNPNIDFDYARAIEAAHGIKGST